MNHSRACSLLGLQPREIDLHTLKKKYRRKCLLVHPDKKGDTKTFLELKDAYDFLSQSLNKPKSSFLDEFDVTLLRSYLASIYQSNLELFKHPLFVKHCVEPVERHLEQYKTYTLRPTLEHLIQGSIYYLEEEQLYIPLWHHEIVFHGKIKVILIPELPDTIELDDSNHVLVDEIGDMVTIGSISILTTEKERQEKRIYGKGIPMIGLSLYDSQRSDIMVKGSLS
jgi:hypothetical protein